MSGRRALALVSLALAVACDSGGGSGGGGRVSLEVSSSRGCFALDSAFPPGLAFLPGDAGRALALNEDPARVVLLDLEAEAPRSLAELTLPDDSDGDGTPEGSGSIGEFPRLDGVFVGDPELAAAGLGLLTASGYEEVIVFDPVQGSLVEVEIEVDAGVFEPEDFRRLPLPGFPDTRTAISTDACIKPAAPIDSNGDDYAAGVPVGFFCDPGVPGSFYARFTSGAAVAASRLFVSMSNLGDGGGTPHPRYLPAGVLVYDLDLAGPTPWVSPNPDVPFIETTAFNPTHVTRVSAAGRELLLVSLTGAIGIAADDPATPEIESQTLALSPAAVEVVDPETLEIVGATPRAGEPGAALLAHAAFAFDRLALHPSGRVAVTGSATRRSVYVFDLAPLEALDTPGELLAEPLPVVEVAVPDLPGGPSEATCAVLTGGYAFSADGEVLYVSERCDGSLVTFDVRLPADGVPIAALHFTVSEVEALLSPSSPATFGELREPSVVRVRPDRPGLDFTGPDLFFLAAQPEGQACAHRAQSL